VQSVVAIWGDFPERLHKGDRVIYVAGEQLVEWLLQQPATLDQARRAALPDGVKHLAQ